MAVCVTALFVAAFSPGCSNDTDDGMHAAAPTARASSAIIGGEESPASEDFVVQLAMRPQGAVAGICSGTLVAPNLVLTARHCVAKTDNAALCTADGDALIGAAVVSDYAASDLVVYRGRHALADLVADSPSTPRAAARGASVVVQGSTLCNGDLAFIVLDRDVPAPYAPVRVDTIATAGELVTGIGYGLVDDGELPAARQHRTNVPVLLAGRYAWPGGVGLGDAELLLGESSCSGDSGGPIVSAAGAVVGVVSRGGGGSGPLGNAAAGCMGATATAIYTHLGTKPSFVASAFAAAGRPIWAEGKPNPYIDGGMPSTTAPDVGADAGTDPASAPADAGAAKAPTVKDAGCEPSCAGDDEEPTPTTATKSASAGPAVAPEIAVSCAVAGAPAPVGGPFGLGALAFVALAGLRRRARR